MNWSRLSSKSTGYNKIGRGGGDRTKSDVDILQVIDSVNGQNRANWQIRRSKVHDGYTEFATGVWQTPMRLGDLLSRKELFDRAHWEKKSLVDFGKLDETILPVERACRFVFRVHNDSRRRDLFAQFEASIQRVH